MAASIARARSEGRRLLFVMKAGGYRSRSRVLRLLRRAVANVEVRRLEPGLTLESRRQAALENAADEQRALHRIGSLSGLTQLLDLGHQAGRVGHVRFRRQEELGRLHARSLDTRGER